MKSLHLLLAVMLLLGLSACYKDKGNYTYHNINDIAIETSDTITTTYGDTLHITPILHQQFSDDESPLSFEWSVLVGTSNLDSTYQLLSTTRNLNMPITVPSQSDYYALFYRVHNSATDITYTKIIRMAVTTNYQTGWLALEQSGAQDDISFINTVQNKVYHHTYSHANPGNPMPASATGVYNLDIPAFQSSNGTVHKSSFTAALFANGGYVLDVKSMKADVDYTQLFMNAPQPVAPSFLGLDLNAEMTTINNGHLYRRVMSKENTFDNAYTMADSSDYQLAPMNANTSNSTTLYFDVLHHRFLKEVYKTRLLNKFTPQTWYSFDPSNVPEQPLALGIGYYKYYQYGVFKVPDMDSCILYSYSQGTPLKRTVMHNSPGVASSQAFVFSTIRYQLYYGAANFLYLYDIQANSAAPVYTFAAGETITAMMANGTTGMEVATYNGSQGFVYSFAFTSTGEIDDTQTTRYEGFDKIISLSYKK
ncbi:PKD-like family protein [Chitinophaga costaii]|uniref:PKD-like family protein n=1 Tax=Chitinophaga costaii TaxID=1335309 RepID=A0A1C4FKM2_9BACT|nr:PKD-like family lipoprotein [Chitinophaga costaii]SCC56547.1 PKD-like family protein [Chitinophaga costaii]